MDGTEYLTLLKLSTLSLRKISSLKMENLSIHHGSLYQVKEEKCSQFLLTEINNGKINTLCLTLGTLLLKLEFLTMAFTG